MPLGSSQLIAAEEGLDKTLLSSRVNGRHNATATV
jgi:hypothetical protein